MGLRLPAIFGLLDYLLTIDNKDSMSGRLDCLAAQQVVGGGDIHLVLTDVGDTIAT